MLKAVDLFSGCGGLSLGFQNAGIDIRAAFENWEVAAKCYELNFILFTGQTYQIPRMQLNLLNL